jgi:hypothetical protein
MLTSADQRPQFCPKIQVNPHSIRANITDKNHHVNARAEETKKFAFRMASDPDEPAYRKNEH